MEKCDDLLGRLLIYQMLLLVVSLSPLALSVDNDKSNYTCKMQI
jgi:hypothetical protein